MGIKDSRGKRSGLKLTKESVFASRRAPRWCCAGSWDELGPPIGMSAAPAVPAAGCADEQERTRRPRGADRTENLTFSMHGQAGSNSPLHVLKLTIQRLRVTGCSLHCH
jgi:hypothetical protein